MGHHQPGRHKDRAITRMNQNPGAPAYPPSNDAAMSGQVGAPVYVDSKAGPVGPVTQQPQYPPQQPQYPPQYPPQQPGHPMQYPPPPQVVTQVQYVTAPSYGHSPVTITCPSCNKHITTRTSSEPNSTAWILGLVLCVLGCVPCCLIPCCMDSMKQVTPSCPSCSTTLGRSSGGGL